MKTLIVSAAAIAAAALFIPTPSNAQIGFQGPGFGVQIGGGPYYGGYGYHEPYYGGYRPYDYGEPVVVQPRAYSDYDEPVVQRRVYRQRYVSMPGCRTVTIQRPDGSMRRMRRCG
jgi:hypothetical protein